MDKYARFEAWLRENGARFEQLELREYECNNNTGSKESSASTSSSSSASLGAAAATAGEEKKETSTLDNVEDEQQQQQQHGEADSEEEEESEMRGVHARQHIPPNTVCMSIPRRCLITVEMGQATPIGQAVLQADLDLDAPKHIYLMIYLLWDRKVHGRHSFFAPYYDILPSTLSNMPIFWTPQELQLLQGSYLLQQIADRNQAITADYQTILQVAPSLAQICTLDEFKWARMCVCSRNFGLQMDGHRTSALVPHADMLNHYRPRETKWTFDTDSNAFTITTLQHIPAGAQVYDSYGQKCNHRFLLNYGFAVEQNVELDGFCPNEVPLELYVDPNDSNYAQKMEFWTRGEMIATNNSSSSSHSAMAALAQSGLVGSANSIVSQVAQQALAVESTTSRNSRNNNSSSNHHPRGGNFSFAPYRELQHQNSSGVSSYHSASSASQPSSSSNNTALKRVRVCVSNNENTRLLFSLLRTLACNPAELRAIGTCSASMGGSSSDPTTTSAAASSSRPLFGFSESLRGSAAYQQSQQQQQQQQQSLYNSSTNVWSILSGTPTPTAMIRSCRDLRHPISLRNERAALQLLLQVCTRHLNLYPTTLAQDVADLTNSNSNNHNNLYPKFSNARHAKIQVRGEKQVLHHYIQWARTGLHVLAVIEHELQQQEQQQPSPAAAALSSLGRSSSNNNNNNRGMASSSAAVEVKLTRSGKTTVSTTDEEEGEDEDDEDVHMMTMHSSASSSYAQHHQQQPYESFESLIRRMEDDCDLGGGATSGGVVGVHHTILRYCADVLGSLRREEFKTLKRVRAMRGAGSSNSGREAAAGRATSSGAGANTGGSGRNNGNNISNSTGFHHV